MSIQNATVRGRLLASSNGRPLGGGYKYRKDPDWVPGAGAVRETPRSNAGALSLAAQAAARREEFDRLRDQGMTVAEAGAAVGIARKTARVYEQRRKAGTGKECAG